MGTSYIVLNVYVKAGYHKVGGASSDPQEEENGCAVVLQVFSIIFIILFFPFSLLCALKVRYLHLFIKFKHFFLQWLKYKLLLIKDLSYWHRSRCFCGLTVRRKWRVEKTHLSDDMTTYVGVARSKKKLRTTRHLCSCVGGGECECLPPSGRPLQR